MTFVKFCRATVYSAIVLISFSLLLDFLVFPDFLVLVFRGLFMLASSICDVECG